MIPVETTSGYLAVERVLLSEDAVCYGITLSCIATTFQSISEKIHLSYLARQIYVYICVLLHLLRLKF